MEYSVWEQFKTRELCIWVISGDDLGMRELYKDKFCFVNRVFSYNLFNNKMFPIANVFRLKSQRLLYYINLTKFISTLI